MYRVVWLTYVILALAHGRIYDRCELARDLQNLGVDHKHLSTWVCIAYHESRFDTSANNPFSGDHGIFQISELFWCGPGKACHQPCSAFRDEDISDDLKCALQIHDEHTRLQGDGFRAWVVYPTYCAHNTKKYLVDCDINIKYSVPLSRTKEYFYSEKNVSSVTNIGENTLPGYLAVGDIVRRYYDDQSHNRDSINWYVHKINNIDDLKIPSSFTSLSLPVTERFTTTTPATTTTSTTTTTEYIPPVRPWRVIETNQFRKKKLYNNITPKPKAQEVSSITRNYPDNSRTTVAPKSTQQPTNYQWTATTTASPYSFSKTYFTLSPSTTRNIIGYGNGKIEPLYPTTRSNIFTEKSTTTRWTTSKPTTKRATEISTQIIRITERPTTRVSKQSNVSVTRKAKTDSSAHTFRSRTEVPRITTESLPTIHTTTSRPNSNSFSVPQQTTTLRPRTTQSIFDLYLNPTKPPELPPLKFSSQRSSKFAYKIFDKGTTTSPRIM